MGKLARFQGFAATLGICLSAAIAGCIGGDEIQGSAEDDGPSEDIGEAHQALIYTQDGFKVTWTYVGHPWAARKIAACDPSRIYALNYDYRLYFNASGGDDGAWTYVGYPSAAREIACEDGAIYALNYDKNLYRAYAPDGTLLNAWAWLGKPGQAEHIGSGGPGAQYIYALNTDKTIWTGQGSNVASFLWSYRNTASQADRVTGSHLPYDDSTSRAFALNVDKSLWYNDKLLVSTSGANWHPFPKGGLSFLEISAGAPDVLYGLTTSYDLWKATITEDNCADGIDNNADGRADAHDATCIPLLGGNFCAAHANGNYCYSRFSNNMQLLAKCSGGLLAGTESGGPCVLVGSGGQDYIEVIQ